MRKHTFIWFYRELNDKNIQLLINFKKHLLLKELKDKTIHEYLKEVSNWMKFLQERNTNTLEATVDDLIEYLEKKDVSEIRKTRILSVLNSFYKHNCRKKYAKENIVKKYKKREEEK